MVSAEGKTNWSSLILNELRTIAKLTGQKRMRTVDSWNSCQGLDRNCYALPLNNLHRTHCKSLEFWGQDVVAINFPCFGASPQRFFCVLFFAELRVKLTLHLSPLFFVWQWNLTGLDKEKFPILLSTHEQRDNVHWKLTRAKLLVRNLNERANWMISQGTVVES